MTEPMSTGQGWPDQSQSTADTAKHEARGVADQAASSAGAVGGVAKQEASNVAQEATYQAKDLMRQGRQELMDQASQQQARAADGLRSIHRQLSSMASNTDQQGMGTDLVRQAAEKAGGFADWLDRRDPGSVLNEVKSYARRRPGAFLAIAAGAGLLVGRLTRSLADEARDSAQSSGSGRPLASTDSSRAVTQEPGLGTGTAYPGPGTGYTAQEPAYTGTGEPYTEQGLAPAPVDGEGRAYRDGAAYGSDYPQPPAEYAAGTGEYGSGTGEYAAGTGRYGTGAGEHVAGTGQYGTGADEYAAGAGQYGTGTGEHVAGTGEYAETGDYGTGAGEYGTGAGEYGTGTGGHLADTGEYGPGTEALNPEDAPDLPDRRPGGRDESR